MHRWRIGTEDTWKNCLYNRIGCFFFKRTENFQTGLSSNWYRQKLSSRTPFRPWIVCLIRSHFVNCTQRRTNNNNHSLLVFEQYFQTHEEHDNSLSSRAIGIIVLRRTEGAQGGYTKKKTKSELNFVTEMETHTNNTKARARMVSSS